MKDLVVSELSEAEEAESGSGLGELKGILKHSCYALAQRFYTAMLDSKIRFTFYKIGLLKP